MKEKRKAAQMQQATALRLTLSSILAFQPLRQNRGRLVTRSLRAITKSADSKTRRRKSLCGGANIRLTSPRF